MPKVNQKWVKRLNAAKTLYEEGIEQSKNGGIVCKVEDGVYDAKLVSASFRESKSKNLMCVRTHVITEGEFTGEKITDYGIRFEDSTGLQNAYEWVQIMGYVAPEIDDIASFLEIIPEIEAEESAVRINVKNTTDTDGNPMPPRVDVIQLLEEDPGEDPENPEEDPEEPEEDPEEPEEDQYPDFSEMSRKELKLYIKENKLKEKGVKVFKNDTEDDIVQKLYDVLGIGESETEEEIEEEEETEEESGTDNPLFSDLKQFCESQDIDFDDDDDIDQICERIRAYDYPEDQLSTEIKEMFAQANLQDVIKKAPKPKASTKKPATSKKTAKKAVKRVNRKK